MGVPQGWSDNGTILTAPNNVTVRTGFREYVLSHDWDPANWPLQVEAGRNPLEESNPALGGGTWQPFRWTVLEWDAKRGVEVMWVGQELLKVLGELEAARSAPSPVDSTAKQIASEAIALLHKI